MSDRKKIIWVTPRCFVETDIYAVGALSHDFNITWYIVETVPCQEYSDHITLLRMQGVKVEYLYLPGRNRSLKVFAFYWKLLNRIKKEKFDVLYNPIFGMPYYLPLERIILGKDKVVIALHNVTTPKGAKAAPFPSKLYTYFTSHVFKNYHTFSKSQCSILKQSAKRSNVFYIPFFLKDYGQSDHIPTDVITFLFFGQIIDYKRVDVLIKAAENVFEKASIPFKVNISGSCSNWGKYEQLIKHKELFNLNIHRIPNEDIPDLFSSSHYFVLPYQDIAQSGAIIVAINYGLPIIASSLPAFEELIEDGVNGYLIQPANQDDLEKTLLNVLNKHENDYSRLKNELINFRETNFSATAIKRRYIDEFLRIMKH